MLSASLNNLAAIVALSQSSVVYLVTPPADNFSTLTMIESSVLESINASSY